MARGDKRDIVNHSFSLSMLERESEGEVKIKVDKKKNNHISKGNDIFIDFFSVVHDRKSTIRSAVTLLCAVLLEKIKK